jgi:ribosome-interacting GTPase 1
VNTGKSSLISVLTNLEPNIAEYPFTTRIPQPGMMFHHGIPIQLVDTPALDPSVTERWISGLIRNADISIIVLDLAREDLIEQWEAVHTVLDDLKIRPIEPGGTKTHQDDGWALVPAIYLGNKCAMGEADERLSILRELFDDLPEIHPVSVKTGSGLERFKDLVQHSLCLIRVFSKPPGKEPDLSKPFVVREGATVTELATLVHKELAQRMKFARVWGEQVYDGQRVAMDYELIDGDIVELND